ncbi:MAG: type II secretion system protein GspD [Archangium gephyra]|uniref:Type II secretion system protein GspD n=1 Tax=Archangium gephyra TaxID=48 RepID=A0A2W5SZP5_9BACT|nr:MAG: type II secretion system protein GspD [Archangium gephyra]
MNRSIVALLALVPLVALAQPAPAPGATIAPKKPSCEEQRRKGRYNIYFDKVEIEKLVQTVADVTCRTFILPENIRGKISIIGPENGKVEVNADQFYAAFLAALDSNSLSVYEQGKFMKIIDKQRAKQFPIPTITDPDQPYTMNEQMVTRVFKVKNVEIEQLRGVLQQLVTPSGDTIPFQPDTIIINDLGSNMHRLERVIGQLDTRSASDEIRVIQVQYATAQEIADKIQKLFESKGNKPGQRPGIVSTPPPPGTPPSPAGGGDKGEAGGAATLSQIIPDERTNKLIVIASPSGFERIQSLVREIDIPISGEGRINVYYLENANAEDVAATLQTLAQGTANRPKSGGPPPPAGGKPAGAASAELFAGEVKISADKATNSLVIIASQADYRSLVRVVERLDIRRRQVFVEAVIMEVNLDRNSDLGINLHGGLPVSNGQGGTMPVFFGTKYGSSGLPPSLSLTNLVSMSGFLAGLQGPTIPNLTVGGIQIPAFGIVINAMQKSSDVNVLSTPHILTTDNEEAEITVGQNVPFQSGFSTGGLGGLGGLAGMAGGLGTTGLNTSALGGLSGLGGLGGLGGTPFGTIQRQNVDLKLSVKPQINESDYVRLVITEQIEEIASSDPVLGPTTSKRSAKTTVVAKDQETVVIGGIMQDRMVESVSKTPILGDIPLLGNLFRQQTRRKVKTNLLLFLTPYIIRDGSDFRRIFERKMRERQEFVEQFYGATTGYDVAIDFERKAGPLSRMGQIVDKEMNKLENGGPGTGSEKLITPGGPAAEPQLPTSNEPEATPNTGTEPVPPQPQTSPAPAAEEIN